jgi:hypothetical protein
MKEASEVMPSTQFLSFPLVVSCIPVLHLCAGRRFRSQRRTGRGKGCGGKYICRDRILWPTPNVLGVEMRCFRSRQ